MDHCRNSIRRSDGETAVGVGWIEWLGGGDDPPRPRRISAIGFAISKWGTQQIQ